VDAEHILITKRFVKEVNIVLEITKRKTTIKEKSKYVCWGNLEVFFL
jgi:hypothetical protein